MKKITLIIIAVISLSVPSCSNDDVLKLEKEGYISFNGSIVSPEITSKTVVPECSPFTPNKVMYRLKNADGLVYTQTSRITINGQTVQATDQMMFPVGTYTVDEISLLNDNVITHSVPNDMDPRYDFRDFVEQYLPFQVTISPGEVTTSNLELLCYTIEPISIDPNWEGDGTILDLTTVYFYIPRYWIPMPSPEIPDDGYYENCISLVTIEVFNFQGGTPNRVVEWIIYDYGLNSFPAPKGHHFRLQGYFDHLNNPNPVQTIDVPDYNADGILDQDDILIFADCD